MKMITVFQSDSKRHQCMNQSFMCLILHFFYFNTVRPFHIATRTIHSIFANKSSRPKSDVNFLLFECIPNRKSHLELALWIASPSSIYLELRKESRIGAYATIYELLTNDARVSLPSQRCSRHFICIRYHHYRRYYRHMPHPSDTRAGNWFVRSQRQGLGTIVHATVSPALSGLTTPFPNL